MSDTTGVMPARSARLFRIKHLVFAVIAATAAYVLYHNERSCSTRRIRSGTTMNRSSGGCSRMASQAPVRCYWRPCSSREVCATNVRTAITLSLDAALPVFNDIPRSAMLREPETYALHD